MSLQHGNFQKCNVRRPKADILSCSQKSTIFNGLTDYGPAMWTFEGTPIMARRVGLNLRKPHY